MSGVLTANSFFLSFITLLSDAAFATTCVESNTRSLLQRSFTDQSELTERAVPIGCEGFYEDIDAAQKNVNTYGKHFYNAGAVTVTRAVIANAGGALSAAGAAASGGLTLGFAVVGGLIMPDPNAERLKNIESGMTCLMSAVSKLQQEVSSLREQSAHVASIVGQNSMVPLKDISTTLMKQAKEHQECELLMKCVADTKYVNKIGNNKKYSDSWCEDLMMTDEFKIDKIVTNCDALAFQQKFNQHNDYHPILKDLTHLTDIITTIISESLEDMYVVAHSILAEYTAVATNLFLTWTSVEGWASAICYPLGNGKSSCTDDEEKNVRRGLNDFEKDKDEFMKNFKNFKTLLSSSSFYKKRLNNLITIEHPKLGEETCFVKHVTTRTKEQTTGHMGNIHVKEFKTYYLKEKEYKVEGCSEQALRALYCGNQPCKFTKPANPFYCQEKKCKKWKGCNQYDTTCDDCGRAHCREWTLTFQYDHLSEQIEAMNNITGFFSERNMDVPPYSLPEDESFYPLSTYFCGQKLKPKSKFKKWKNEKCNN